MSKLSSNLRWLRKVSQVEISATLGLSRTLYSSWECERSFPNIYDLKKLSDFHKVSIDWMIRRDLSKLDKRKVLRNYIQVQEWLDL